MVVNVSPADPCWFTPLSDLRDECVVLGVQAEQFLEHLAHARPTALRYINFLFDSVDSYYDERNPVLFARYWNDGIKRENGNTTLHELFGYLQIYYEDDDDEAAMLVWPEDVRAVMLIWFATTPRRRDYFLKLVAVHLRTAGLTALEYYE